MKDNTKQIRGLLEAGLKKTDRLEETLAFMDLKKCVEAVIALLPPVCGKCWGSKRVPNPEYYGRGKEIYHSEYIPCPACQAPASGEAGEKPFVCKECGKTFPAFMQKEYQGHEDNCRATPEAPAGEVEMEFVEVAQKTVPGCKEGIVLKPCLVVERLKQACTHLTAQAKELKLFRKNFCEAHQPLPEDTYNGCYCCDAVAQAKQIEGLEAGAFGANEEAQIRNEQIQQLEAEKKGLEKFIIDWDGHVLTCNKGTQGSCDCGYQKAKDQALQKGAEE